MIKHKLLCSSLILADHLIRAKHTFRVVVAVYDDAAAVLLLNFVKQQEVQPEKKKLPTKAVSPLSRVRMTRFTQLRPNCSTRLGSFPYKLRAASVWLLEMYHH